MKVDEKYEMICKIEYRIRGDADFDDGKMQNKLSGKVNKSQVKAAAKGVKLTIKYLKKMKRLGFEIIDTKREILYAEDNN